MRELKKDRRMSDWDFASFARTEKDRSISNWTLSELKKDRRMSDWDFACFAPSLRPLRELKKIEVSLIGRCVNVNK